MQWRLLVLLCLLMNLNMDVRAQGLSQSIANQELIQHGKTFYLERCIGCHGEKGDGKGTASVFLAPKPRDFTSGLFKFKSTPLEALPSDEDLMRTLSMGVPGTSMPSFFLEPEVSRLAVIEYIKSFSTAWKDPTRIQPVLIGASFPREDFLDASKFLARAEKGKTIFKDACLTCHGATGLGDGPASTDLTDEWGEIIRPANLQSESLKSGRSVESIYRVLLSGLAGTPMPSFLGVYSNEELWDVTAYVLYLRGLGNNVYSIEAPPLLPLQVEE